MLINLSEVFTLEGKERTWTVPLEMREPTENIQWRLLSL